MFNIPLKKIDIQRIYPEDFNAVLKTNDEKLKIIVIEDIDCLFKKNTEREVKDNVKISFEQILEQFSGASNCLFFVTTNHIEKLDEALIRDGRIDIKIKMPDKLDLKGRIMIAEFLLEGQNIDIPSVIDEGKDDTIAQFRNRCVKLLTQKLLK
jgi:chaperone BCS1